MHSCRLDSWNLLKTGIEHGSYGGFVVRFIRKVFFVMFLLFLANTSHPADLHAQPPTPLLGSSEMQQLENALALVVGDDSTAFLGFRPEIRVIKSSVPNAYATPHREIVVSSGLLSLAESTEELAFALAHEIGHLSLHHLSSTRSLAAGRFATEARVDEEVAADAYAISLLARSGIDQRVGLSLLQKLCDFGVDRGARWSDLYPSLGRRLRALKSVTP